uniref:Uncharacterized protein n=1 Tax=Cacopsylla melanoneura TaxID=428564 RepID=A0A8D8VQM0_9HEMI
MYFLFLFSLSLFLLFLHCFYLFAPLTICLSFNLSFLSIFSTLPPLFLLVHTFNNLSLHPMWKEGILHLLFPSFNQTGGTLSHSPWTGILSFLIISTSFISNALPLLLSSSNFLSPRLGLYFFKHGYFNVYGTLPLP